MSSVSSLTAVFSNIQLQLARYVYCPLYIAGNVGNILNLLVFSQAKLRTSSVCSWYFLAASVASLIAINTGYLTRILTNLGLPDPSRTIGWYCTGRVYIPTVSLTLIRHFLCSIVIDRFLVTSTSVKLRRISSFKVAKWYIPLSVLCWMIFYSHIWVGYPASPNGLGCKRWGGAYSVFITVSTLMIEVIIPTVVMIVFSVLTINNVHGLRQRRNRIMPNTNGIQMTIVRPMTMNNATGESTQTLPLNQQIQREQKKVDKQLTTISLIQVIVYFMFNSINGIYSIYTISTSSIIKSADRSAIESFISATTVLLTYVYATVS
jgi:hypothetical protein